MERTSSFRKQQQTATHILENKKNMKRIENRSNIKNIKGVFV